MFGTTTRVVLAVVGTLMVVAGLSGVGVGGSFGTIGLWLTIAGAVLVVAVLVERQRYRSEEADRAFEAVGPGGGEPVGPMEPRFRPTDERFVDPTTGVQMMVLVDPRTGERRYVAEA